MMKKQPKHYFATGYCLPVEPDGSPLKINDEFVKAIPIDQFCQQNNLTKAQVLTMLRRKELRAVTVKKWLFVSRNLP